LIFSQLVTLYLTPVVYTYMATFQSWLKRDKKRKKVGAMEPIIARD
jgi:hypothetical protein